MKKRRINWSLGNPAFPAWEVDCPSGPLVVRRNHPLIRSGERHCEGWDIWLDGRYLGAIGSRPLGELIDLSQQDLPILSKADCCSRHQEFPCGPTGEPVVKRGGRRPNAGRKPKGRFKRVRLSVTVEPETLSLLDRVRGDRSRGQYLDTLMRSRRR
jgi:hypothetical protein